MKTWKRWTDEEDGYVRGNYGRIRTTEIAKTLGRSPDSIRHRASLLGIADKTAYLKVLHKPLELRNREALLWFLGFLEGEGSFHIAVSPREKSNLGYSLRPQFSITLAERDKKSLDFIRDILSDYGIHSTLTYRNRKVKSSSFSNQYYLNVQGIRNCIRLMKILDGLNWHTSKRGSFDSWERCLMLMTQNKHLNKDGFLEIIREKQRMSPTKGLKTKYTLDWFLRLWGR